MMVHMEDRGELNILIGDGGGVVFVCAKCKKTWTSRLAPEVPIVSDAGVAVSNTLLNAVHRHSILFKEVGYKTDILDKILSLKTEV